MEEDESEPQSKAELTTDRTDATDKGNQSNPLGLLKYRAPVTVEMA
jgi:hypothetical protein